MANRSYLLNTSILVDDPYSLRINALDHGYDYLEADGPGYRIPIPWLCCFRPHDLKAVVIQAGADDNGVACSYVQHMPSTTVAQAILNLEQALPLFEIISGDSTLARAYWLDALAFLRILPLPYLALDPGEILDLMGAEEGHDKLVRALGGSTVAIPYLKYFSDYEEGVLPYSIDVARSVSGVDRRRERNAFALDVAGYAIWQRDGAERNAGDAAVFVPTPPGRRSFDTINERINALLAAREPAAYAYFRCMPVSSTLLGRMRSLLSRSQPVRVKMLLGAETNAQRDMLLADHELRMLLDGDIADQLREHCIEHGLEWAGFVMESRDSLKRRFKDMEDWVLLPSISSAGK